MRSRLVVGCVALAIGAAACGGGDGHVAAKHKALPTTTSTTQGPPVAPLTGLPDPTGQSFRRPALSVKIENAPEARPQTGLQNADIVYEQIVEYGITRFMAVFNSNVPPILGPIRSGPLMDPVGAARFMTTDGGQVAPNNVIIQFVGASLPTPEGGSFNTVGSGDAFVFSAGKLMKGKWSKASRPAPTQFTDATGAPIRLTPGRT